MKSTNLHAVIAGGGLAGALLALVLAERGYKVTVIEKRADLRSEAAAGGRSINLALSERGLHALSIAGLRNEALKQTIPMRGRLIHGVDGSTKRLPYSSDPNEFIRSISRPGLNRLLLQAAGKHPHISLYFNSSVLSVSPGTQVVEFQPDGEPIQRVEYDLLFGADGAGSAVRASLGLESKDVFSREMLEHGYKELEMPALESGDFAMPHDALHIWPRGTYMLIALPNLDNSFTCTLFLPLDGDPGFNQLNDPGTVQAFFETQFPDAVPLLPNLQGDFFGNPTGMLGTIRCSSWTQFGNSLILGDAAHAVVPFFGQGMNCAFEDVSVLASMLDSNPETAWPELLSAFEAERIPNANAIADMALENYIEMRDLVADEGFQFRRRVGLELEQRFPDRFIPRYSLVSFNRVPYQEVQEMGRAQAAILEQLCASKSNIEEINWSQAENLVLSLPLIG
ncbi:FAD-dependent monooxygenase [bacterium]|nr:FAD-dependent monooxygenase [bacterium]